MTKEKIEEVKKGKKASAIKHRKIENSRNRIRNVRKWNGSPIKIQSYIEKHNRNCDICGRNEAIVGTLHIDHCHERNIFRGLLCSTCNTGLGQFKDDIQRLLSAIEYLKKPLPDLSEIPSTQIQKNVEIDETEGIKQENIIRGEMASWSKLKQEQVQEIREKLAEGIKIAVIAKEYGVSRMAIYAIRNGKNWKPL